METRNYDCKTIFPNSANIIPTSGNPFFISLILKTYFSLVKNIFLPVKVFIPRSGKILETYQFSCKTIFPCIGHIILSSGNTYFRGFLQYWNHISH